MGGTKGKVATGLAPAMQARAWDDPRWLGLPGPAKQLAMYLALSPGAGVTGIQPWERDLVGWRAGLVAADAMKAAETALTRSQAAWWTTDKATGQTWVWHRARYETIKQVKRGETPTLRAAAEAELAKAPEALRRLFADRYGFGDGRQAQNPEAPDATAKTKPRRMTPQEEQRWAEKWIKAATDLHELATERLRQRGPAAMAAWTAGYPGLDVARCLREANAWLAANPDRRRDLLRFLHNWMRRTAQDDAKKRPAATAGAESYEELKRRYGTAT